MKKKGIYALGIGHNTPVFIDLAEACGFQIMGLYHYNDTRTDEIDHGFKILGSFDNLFALENLVGMQFVLTMGDSKIRGELSKRIIEMGGKVPTLIHPSAVISRFAHISEIGVCISPFSYVQADSTIGDNTVILSHVNISHNTSIGSNCFIAGNATIGAYTIVENDVFVGQGALSISGKVEKIGAGSYIGARTLITRDVPQKTVFVGIPGKVMKNK